MSSRGRSKREVIKAQALLLFAANGVHAVSVADIAAACDMTKPNLYAHFASKEELVRELFQQGYRDYGRRMAEAAAAAGPFRVRLERLVRLICHLHDEDRSRFRFILMAQHDNLHAIAIDEHNPVEIVVRVVADAMAKGEIPARNAELVAAGIVGLVVQPATFLLHGRIGAALSTVADEIVSMCMRVAT
jgi:AcrR family transcriptional regulator